MAHNNLLWTNGQNLHAVNPELFLELQQFRKQLQQTRQNQIAESSQDIIGCIAEKYQQVADPQMVKNKDQQGKGNHPLKHSPSPSPSPSPQFPSFPQLPRELRQMIWQISATQRRVVELELAKTPNRTRFVSKTGAPTLMFVNQESRQVGLRLYTLLDSGDRRAENTYINWAADIVLFKTAAALAKFLEEIARDGKRGRNSARNDTDSMAVKAAKRTMYQQINRSCRNLAVWASSNHDQIDILERHLAEDRGHLPAFENLVLISAFTDGVGPEGGKDHGKVVLSPVDSAKRSDAQIMTQQMAKRFPQARGVSAFHATRHKRQLVSTQEKEERHKEKAYRLRMEALNAQRALKASKGGNATLANHEPSSEQAAIGSTEDLEDEDNAGKASDGEHDTDDRGDFDDDDDDDGDHDTYDGDDFDDAFDDTFDDELFGDVSDLE